MDNPGILRLFKFPFRWAIRLLSSRNKLRQVANYVKYRLSGKAGETVNYLPLRLGIFTKYECNLKCRMCLTHSPLIPDNPYKYKGAKEMELGMFKDIIKRFGAALGCSFIGNGEPLLCKDLFSMIEYAYRNKMYTQVFTNGLILDKFIDTVLDSRLGSLNISVNSFDRVDYNRLTGLSPDTLGKILDNARGLIDARNKRKSKLYITGTVIADKYNYKMIPEMIGTAESLGFDYLGFFNIMPAPVPGLLAEGRCLFAGDPEVRDFFARLRLGGRKIKAEPPVLLDACRDNRLCRDSFFSMSIDGNGDVNGCERQLLNSRGNGKYYDRDVFNNSHFRTLRRVFLSSNLELPLPCRYCYNNSRGREKQL